jgi:hypothetical protein
MSEQEGEEFTAPEAVNASVAKILDLPDKVLLSLWVDDGPKRFVLSCPMADFLAKGLAQTVAELSLPSDEHQAPGEPLEHK